MNISEILVAGARNIAKLKMNTYNINLVAAAAIAAAAEKIVLVVNKVNIPTGKREYFISVGVSDKKCGFHATQPFGKQSRSPFNIVYLAESRRSYSTLRKNEQFWRKVNSRDLSDLDNPFIIVNNFKKKYPTKDLAKPHINLDLIHSILTRHIFNFELTSKTFNFLNEISPIRLELPASSSKLAECW